MKSSKILFSWIGHTDIRAMISELPQAKKKEVIDITGLSEEIKDTKGPIKSLLSHEKFDQIHLLSNYPTKIGNYFKSWIEGKVTVTDQAHSVSFGPGDLVVFPNDLSCTWNVHEAVTKYYNFG